jgi:FkbM family methyltransferase
MKNFLKNISRPFLGKSFGQKFFAFLYLFSLKGMNFGGGTSPKYSGEEYAAEFAIETLGKKQLVVFDVGGNKGDYTKMWLDLGRQKALNLAVKVFEPSSSALIELERIFSQNNKVKIIGSAIGEQDGQAVLYADHPGSGLGSLAKRDLKHVQIEMTSQEKVGVRSLDSFCSEQQIEEVDFLKLDVEGFELLALKGAKNLIDKGKINFIQFEFGGTDIDTRVFFKDFFQMLHPRYNVYRILKNGLWQIKEYSELEEVFLTTNYLAQKK